MYVCVCVCISLCIYRIRALAPDNFEIAGLLYIHIYIHIQCFSVCVCAYVRALAPDDFEIAGLL